MKKAKTAAIILFSIFMLLAVASLPGASPAMAQNYIVNAGDTLFSIGQKFGVPVEELITANNLSSEMIYPEQRLRIPPVFSVNAPDKRYILGFYVDREDGLPGSYGTMSAYSSQISAVATFWHRISPDNPVQIEEHRAADGSGPGDLRTVIEDAHRDNIQVFALVHNMIYPSRIDGAGLAAAVLGSEETRSEFINQLESMIKKYGYDGVNLDIENIKLDDRDKYSLLVKELFERLNPQGYKVTVCVPAKTHDNLTSTWSGPFDYKEIGRYSDSVVIMTYDEHGYASGPGPIASSGWVGDVARYAAENIPPEKILLGIPGYGFDWTAGQTCPRYISFAQAVSIAESQQASILWDDTAQSPYFKYGAGDSGGHEVWFENAASLNCKLDIVAEYGMKGIAIWRLGMEDPAVWGILNNRVKAEKEDLAHITGN